MTAEPVATLPDGRTDKRLLDDVVRDVLNPLGRMYIAEDGCRCIGCMIAIDTIRKEYAIRRSSCRPELAKETGRDE